ncbi:MAG TPA: hypothetical protein VFL73_04580 [Solirubrobacteraceae bacterium]|jgi:hypothetical protein|nr:hypothetical protein [Solirubrobacteraceae bacterium]
MSQGCAEVHAAPLPVALAKRAFAPAVAGVAAARARAIATSPRIDPIVDLMGVAVIRTYPAPGVWAFTDVTRATSP